MTPKNKTPSISVIIPCYNEEITIKKVIEDFTKEMKVYPDSKVTVYDNNSSDNSLNIIRKTGVNLKHCKKQGKGAVLRKAFHEEDSDILIIVDGDDTYPAEAVHSLIEEIYNGADMVVGDRISNGKYFEENKRPLHNFGNTLVCKSINLLFRTNLKDIMSGYRALTNRFYKSCPVLLNGFEVETEMSLQAVDKLFDVREIPINYRDRPEGSFSKLNTLSDGILVLRSILWMFKDVKPLIFFTLLTLLQLLVLVAITIFSHHPITPLLISTIIITSSITLLTGFILDTLIKFHKENFELRLNQKDNAKE